MEKGVSNVTGNNDVRSMMCVSCLSHPQSPVPHPQSTTVQDVVAAMAGIEGEEGVWVKATASSSTTCSCPRYSSFPTSSLSKRAAYPSMRWLGVVRVTRHKG